MRKNHLKDVVQQQFKNGFKKGYAKGYQDAIPFTIKNYSSVLLLCLKDHFDFTPEQLSEVSHHIDFQFEAINEGRVSFNDIAMALKDEDNIEISYNGVADMCGDSDE